MNRICAVLFATISAAILLGGCGSGGNSGGGGPGGGTADSRSVLLDSIAAKFARFDGSNPNNENQQLLAFLRAKSEFVDSGISTSGGVWGRFADGKTLVIANNVSRTQTRAALPLRRSRSGRTRAPGFHTTDNVILGSSFGSFWAAATAEFSPWFLEQNYSPIESGATVDSLKGFSNVGVLFLLAHGVACPIRQGRQNVYIVWTNTKRAKDGSTDAKYSEDLRDGSLTYFMGLSFDGDENSITRTVETHYGITHSFVTKYWTGKFNPNSLVFIDACSSASAPDGIVFGTACLNAGACPKVMPREA